MPRCRAALAVAVTAALLLLAGPSVPVRGDDPKKDPPKPAADEGKFLLRLEAARLITGEYERATTVLKIAIDAAESGRPEIVKKCVEAMPPGVTGVEVLSELFLKLAGAGAEAEAIEMAKVIKDVETRDKILSKLAQGLGIGPAALWKAAEEGQTERVKALLTKVADKNAKDKDGETALMKAAANGHVAACKALLTQNVEAWESDAKGENALMKAAANGQEAVVRLIVTTYFEKQYPKDNPMVATDREGMNALMKAAAKGHPGIVSFLLTVHYYRGTSDRTIIVLTYDDTFSRLLDVNAKSKDGKTALQLAEEAKHKGVVDLLKEVR
jgi:Ankyrin repeats (3 copies)